MSTGESVPQLAEVARHAWAWVTGSGWHMALVAGGVAALVTARVWLDVALDRLYWRRRMLWRRPRDREH